MYCVGGLYTQIERGAESVVRIEPSYMVVTNTSFTHNIAQETGGALFTSKPDAIDVCGMPYVLEILIYNPILRAGVIQLPRLQNASLAHNYRPCLETWTGNKAADVQGGDIVASVATSVVVSTDHLTCYIEEDCSISITNHTSGDDLARIYVELFDAFGQLALGQPQTQVHIIAPSDVILSNHLFMFKRAKAELTGIRLLTMVNSTHDLTLTFKPRVLDNIRLQVQVRECLPGETQDNRNEKCQSCGQNSYSFDPSGSCRACPLFAVCTPSTITPESYFWHSASQSAYIQRCIYQEACNFEGRDHLLWEQAWNAHKAGYYLDYHNNTRYQQCKKV